MASAALIGYHAPGQYIWTKKPETLDGYVEYQTYYPYNPDNYQFAIWVDFEGERSDLARLTLEDGTEAVFARAMIVKVDTTKARPSINTGWRLGWVMVEGIPGRCVIPLPGIMEYTFTQGLDRPSSFRSKGEFVGDGYIVTGGLPTSSSNDHKFLTALYLTLPNQIPRFPSNSMMPKPPYDWRTYIGSDLSAGGLAQGGASFIEIDVEKEDGSSYTTLVASIGTSAFHLGDTIPELVVLTIDPNYSDMKPMDAVRKMPRARMYREMLEGERADPDKSSWGMVHDENGEELGAFHLLHTVNNATHIAIPTRRWISATPDSTPPGSSVSPTDQLAVGVARRYPALLEPGEEPSAALGMIGVSDYVFGVGGRDYYNFHTDPEQGPLPRVSPMNYIYPCQQVGEIEGRPGKYWYRMLLREYRPFSNWMNGHQTFTAMQPYLPERPPEHGWVYFPEGEEDKWGFKVVSIEVPTDYHSLYFGKQCYMDTSQGNYAIVMYRAGVTAEWDMWAEGDSCYGFHPTSGTPLPCYYGFEYEGNHFFWVLSAWNYTGLSEHMTYPLVYWFTPKNQTRISYSRPEQYEPRMYYIDPDTGEEYDIT